MMRETGPGERGDLPLNRCLAPGPVLSTGRMTMRTFPLNQRRTTGSVPVARLENLRMISWRQTTLTSELLPSRRKLCLLLSRQYGCNLGHHFRARNLKLDLDFRFSLSRGANRSFVE